MEYEEANGKINLNQNTDRTSKGSPHYKGRGEVAGNLVWASCWINRNEDGSQWLKIETQPRRSLPETVQRVEDATAPSEFDIQEPAVAGERPQAQPAREADLIPEIPATPAERMMREDDVPF
tara:strand:+ start:254 stop:619 length:366 start_codon:yes stop_codon:yes gene_type:complete